MCPWAKAYLHNVACFLALAGFDIDFTGVSCCTACLQSQKSGLRASQAGCWELLLLMG